ncbi:ATP-binding protein [Pseudomonas sp. LJDD11]|uniref:ATP-binding protein n=1 Tax=Pseudomonas sp. LJDD11 TaxID=2931984 RepID=UPI0027B8C003|nr:ATP-binding protein [Pseudomonas sp. LJDD11]
MPTKALAPIAHNSPRAEDTCALSLKWCYQLLLELGEHRTFIRRHGLNDDDLAVELGLGKWVDADEASPVQLRRALRGAARQFDVDHPCLTYPDRLAANLMALGELLALNETELQVLGFCVLMCSDPILNDTTDQLGMLGFNRAVRVLSVLLGLPQPRVEACLSNDSALVRSGLLEVSTSARASMVLTAIISVANPELPGLLRYSQGTALELFSYAFRLSPSGNLAHEHYSHLRQPLTIAERYLNKALINKRRGVNILLYGPPGTGKTAFGRWLAQALGKPLLAKRVSDLVSPYVGMTEQNLAGAFEQAQQQDAVLLLDEVDSFLQDRRKARQSWEITAVNEMLTQMESYRGLFIASTNLIADLDQASLRRFDLQGVLRLPERAAGAVAVRHAPQGSESQGSTTGRRQPPARRSAPDAGRLCRSDPPSALQALRHGQRAGHCPARRVPPETCGAATADRFHSLIDTQIFGLCADSPQTGIIRRLTAAWPQGRMLCPLPKRSRL